MPFIEVHIITPDYTTLLERVGDCIGVCDGDTYAEIDGKFLTKLKGLSLPDGVEDTVFGVWLKVTDHEKPSRMSSIKPREMALLINAFERIVAN